MYTVKEILKDYPDDLTTFKAIAKLAGLYKCPQCHRVLWVRIRQRPGRNSAHEKEIKCNRRTCRKRYTFKNGTIWQYNNSPYDRVVLMLYLFAAANEIEPVVAARYAGLDRKTGMKFGNWFTENVKEEL